MTKDEAKVLELEEVIGYSFKDKQLLIEALTHSSYVNERKLNRSCCYERIEFLGDAVLETVSSTLLFKLHPEMNEGELSKTRASLVCEKALAPCARKMKLGGFILLGRGEKLNHGDERDSILADVVEAIIGAIYLEAGFEEAKRFILENVLDEEDLKKGISDYKTELQELVQGCTHEAPRYELISSSGPEHNRIFEVSVYIGDREFGHGCGSSRKAAEKAAAEAACLKFKRDGLN